MKRSVSRIVRQAKGMFGALSRISYGFASRLRSAIVLRRGTLRVWPRQGRQIFPLEALKGLLERTAGVLSLWKLTDLILLLSSLAVVIYLCAGALRSKSPRSTDISDSPAVGPVQTTPERDSEGKAAGFFDAGTMRPFSYYEGVLRRRNVFAALKIGRGEGTVAKRPIRLGELAADLSVSGIFFDQNPQAVIQDRGRNKTYFVTEGQYIDDILVKKIERGKVVLTYKGEEMELVF